MTEAISTGRRLLAVAFAILLLSTSATATVGAVTTGPSTQEYQSVVIFRNDDVQPWYRADALDAVNDVFAEEEIPVTHAVIPTIDGQPVTESGDFCARLREMRAENPDIEYALHGYDHGAKTAFYRKSEFGGLPADRQREMVAEGREALTNCVGPTKTFVPPFNTHDRNTTLALREAGYTTVSANQWFNRGYYGEEDVFVADGMVHVPSSESFVANWTTNQFKEPDALRASFESAYEDGSLYVQMLHYPTFDDERKVERLRSFVQFVKGHEDVKFTTLGEFAQAYRTGRLLKTDDGWLYHEGGQEPFPRPFAANERDGWMRDLRAAKPRDELAETSDKREDGRENDEEDEEESTD